MSDEQHLPSYQHDGPGPVAAVHEGDDTELDSGDDVVFLLARRRSTASSISTRRQQQKLRRVLLVGLIAVTGVGLFIGPALIDEYLASPSMPFTPTSQAQADVAPGSLAVSLWGKKHAPKQHAKETKKTTRHKKKNRYHYIVFKILEELANTIDGDVYFPWDWEAFPTAAKIWNRAIRNPLVVIEVANEHDVQETVPVLASLQEKYGIPFRIRSGGHNYAGYSSVPGGIVLSLVRIDSISVTQEDPDTGTAVATLGPAVTVQDVLDNVLVPKGYGGVMGLCGGVAESGYALNGGVGYLSRLYGLGLDNILSARIVLADGSVALASATENPDLVFALRGAGGGNFGVVTELEYSLHKSQDTQLVGAAKLAYEDLGTFFQAVGEHEKDIPGEVFIFFESMGEPEVLVSWFGADDASLVTGKSFLEETLPAMLPVDVTVHVEPVSWAESTRAAGNIEGNLVQAWNGFLTVDNNSVKIWDRIMNTVVAGLNASDYLMTDVELWGGAIGAANPEDTAFPHRGALFNVGVLLLVPNDMKNSRQIYEEEVDKVNDWWFSISRYLDGVYLNYPMESLTVREYPLQYWGTNLGRLMELKNKYDPGNVFNFQQSVPLHMV